MAFLPSGKYWTYVWSGMHNFLARPLLVLPLLGEKKFLADSLIIFQSQSTLFGLGVKPGHKDTVHTCTVFHLSVVTAGTKNIVICSCFMPLSGVPCLIVGVQ
jgi:hypothetical protein